MQNAPKRPNFRSGEGKMHHKGEIESVAWVFSESKLKENAGDVAGKATYLNAARNKGFRQRINLPRYTL